MTEIDTPPANYVVFETPGLLDTRSLTLMGVSAKPNSDTPIGYFGTGLKLSVATLVRMGAELSIYIGSEKWTVVQKTADFRGTEITQLQLLNLTRKSLWGGAPRVDLPFSITYGRNWEPWMVFRELESNTRDENGITYSGPTDPGPLAAFDATRIVVRHPDFEKAFQERDTIFLPGHIATGSGIQVVAGSSKHLYRRGVRAYDTVKPCLQTYNFLDDLTLTEDRTIKHEGVARLMLGRFVQRSHDESMIERVLTAGKEFWEHDMLFDESMAPSAEFHRVALRHPKKLPPGFYGYYGKYDPRVTKSTFELSRAHPGPWEVKYGGVYDKNGVRIFEAPYNYSGKWELAATQIVKQLGRLKKEEAPSREPPTSLPLVKTDEDDVPF